MFVALNGFGPQESAVDGGAECGTGQNDLDDGVGGDAGLVLGLAAIAMKDHRTSEEVRTDGGGVDGAHLAQPAAAVRTRSKSSRMASAAPLSPTAPMREPPNHPAVPRSCRERASVFRDDMVLLVKNVVQGPAKVAGSKSRRLGRES